MKLISADCWECGERIYPQFQKKCPNGCDKISLFPGKVVKKHETEIPDEAVKDLIKKLEVVK